MRPEDVPEDVWECAAQWCGAFQDVEHEHAIQVTVARAIIAAQEAQRERDALIAEAVTMRVLDDKGTRRPIWGRSFIAAAIRGGQQ